MKYNHLFSPIKLNSMMLRNRIIYGPMGIIPSHKIISSTNYLGMSNYDKSLSKAALIHIVGAGENLFSKYNLDKTKEAINVCKQDGCKVSYELELFSLAADENGIVYGVSDTDKTKAYTIDAIQKLKEHYISVARNCRKIGFDAITLEFGHDSLPSYFLSPIWNKRKDEYGGSLENRCRFIMEMALAIRQAVGKDFPLILRVSRNLMVPESYEESDMLYLLQQLETIIDMVDVSNGMDIIHQANVHAVPTIFEPHNYNKEFAKLVKENTKLIVALDGAVVDHREADQLIKEGYCDCIFFARSAIADPYWPAKLLEDKEEDIVPCIRCNQCYHIATNHENVQCSVNPRFRRENRMCMTMPFETKKKHIVIVGGGVAGMIAAISGSENGHKVTLIEKNDYLGGLLKYASKGPFKQDLRRYYDYLLSKIARSNVQVLLKTVANKELIEQLRPDRLIIAIGSSSKELNISGKERMMDCLEAIAHPEQVGQKIVIVGGGSIGCELGLEFALDNKDVTIVEMANDIALNGNMLYRIALKQHLEKQNNIHIITDALCQMVKENTVLMKTSNGQQEISYDTIINSAGRQSNSDEAFQFYGICPDTVMIGDCERIGSIVDISNIAYFVGKSM